ncbi:hypothetical protein GCM10008955_19380 [Deinococcus malanensis]|uniref:Homeodomain phBC6A51-type domain-containing protein n=1 Tax=Deinococcus malanensis TaxID=1706855 RepID=A0ABQ2EXP5_9DEIO|nr:hypothetical protein [Deinococcus malanensis]GGK25776.1 hypothetical protein GCM10008955_19380 [Deinococcus malanensis]
MTALTIDEQAQAPLLPGDPADWTPAQKTRHERMCAFLRALQDEGMLLAACTASGVNITTVWRWREQYPVFEEAVTRFMNQTRVAKLEENMYRIANSTDPKMAMASVRANEFLMKAWDRPQYGDFQKVETTQTVNHMVQVVNADRDRHRNLQQQKLRQLRERTIDADDS